MAKPVVCVAVRELIEFVLRTGDLGGDRDFVGPNRALAGTRGHQQIQRSRPSGYKKEVRLAYDIDAGELVLRVQGRIDGILPASGGALLEEIKTIQGDWDRTPDSLHWAQVKIYGFIYAHDQGLTQIDLRLVYLELENSQTTEFAESFTFAALSEFFRTTTAVYLDWVRERFAWCQRRDASIRAVPFPFRKYRAGQRAIAVATYRAIAAGQRLFCEAPTGIGKTVSILFPAVKALPSGKVERVFYLTARTTGAAAAEQACREMRAAGLELKTMTITAKEKVCVQQGRACDPSLCPLALGYYDRRHAAMRALLQSQEITRSVLEQVAQQHQVCPFELSLDVSMWVDAVICDYNYVFDPQVYLRRHFGEEHHASILLVDEAHNLVDRAREMFSAEMTMAELREVRQALQGAVPRCAKALSKLGTALRKLAGEASLTDEGPPENAEGELPLVAPPAPASGAPALSVKTMTARPGSEVRVLRAFPVEVKPVLDEALKRAEEWLARNEPAEFRTLLLQLYFRLLSLARTAERYDECFRTMVEPGGRRVRLFCLDPSKLLSEALQRAQAAVFVSATLSPLNYFRELLGGRPEDPVLQLDSPFPREQLAVLVHDGIRTDFQARMQTLAAVAETIATVVGQRPGNYLVYLPSFQYLDALQQCFQGLYPSLSVLIQRAGMSDTERAAFLSAFSAEPAGPQVGFAVMGGVFGEGVDLVGDRLIGALIVGVGLPQLCIERDLIRDHFDEKNGAGFDYAYRFPGLNRVLQAAGRVIRSETDRGVVLLIDTRFGQAANRRWLPPWWNMVRARSPRAITGLLQRFWDGTTP